MSPLTEKPAKLKFLLDENVDVRLTSFLKKLGFSVLVCPKGLKNGAVLALADKESCVLLTNDKDFANLGAVGPSESAGIVVFRVHPPVLSKLESALSKLLKEVSPKEFSGKVFLLSETGVEILVVPSPVLPGER
ncbi:DUF5615 family PIN-like protein [Microgenomates group bacterium]|nr:DUF5615 family PIN-like protein [Microgenomates group bacterium]